MDRLALGEAPRPPVAESDDLVGAGPQVHLHAPGFLVPASVVLELVEVEVGPEFAIDPMEQVQVELRGDSLAIIVGGVKNLAGPSSDPPR